MEVAIRATVITVRQAMQMWEEHATLQILTTVPTVIPTTRIVRITHTVTASMDTTKTDTTTRVAVAIIQATTTTTTQTVTMVTATTAGTTATGRTI